MTAAPSSTTSRWARKLGLTREQLEVAAVVTFYMVAALTVRIHPPAYALPAAHAFSAP